MNTKYLMMVSSVFMGLAGLSATFLPAEILNYIGLNSTVLSTLLIQITGALYLGFALMNWMAKTVLIGVFIQSRFALEIFYTLQLQDLPS